MICNVITSCWGERVPARRRARRHLSCEWILIAWRSSCEAAWNKALSTQPDSADDPGILRQWYSEHYSSLVKFLHSRFGAGPPEPEDIAQRTFSRLLRRADLLEVANPRAFLWRIAHNMVVSEHRAADAARRGVENLTVLSVLDEGYLLVPERVLEAEEQMQAAVEALEQMPDRRRNVLLMVRVDGMTQREVALRLGITAPAVSKHLAIATTQLYHALLKYPGAND